jgi:TPR repeat protein
MPHENLQPQNQREASEQIRVQPELGPYPPQGISPGEVTSAGSSDSLVHPPKANTSSLKHFRSASSLARAPPDTPIGARSFSVPLNPSLGSQGGTSSVRSESPTSNGQDPGAYSARSHNRASKSVDLSHLYLLNVNESAHFTMTNESLSDVSHNLIKQYLGEHSQSTLLPRMKTIEMYRKNVKKSNDPKVLFQYAQYMLQTALTLDTNPSTPPEGSNNKGESLEKNMKKQFLKEAVHYLRKLSDKGYTDAQYLLGDAYSSGALGKVDNREALSLFQGAAKHGHVESAYRTAYCYEEGLGTTRDSRRAIDFLKFAASKNHPAAMYKLGMYSFYSKMGLPDNVNVKKSGIQWLTRATAKANDLTNAAPYELAKIQDAGFLDIVIPDHKYAMELYVQSASLGHVKSAAILGKAYELGDEVVQQNPDLSIHYYSQAALGGDAESMLALCAWYLVGNPPNLEKNHEEAFQWALSAANLKYPKALYTMGHFYEKGIGCAVNLETAKTWYIMAMDKGDERAKTKLQKLNSPTSVPLNEPKPLEKKEKKKKDKKGKKKDRDCVIM